MENLTKNLPQGSDHMGEFVDSLLEVLPPRYGRLEIQYPEDSFRAGNYRICSRWRNWVVRGFFSVLMVGAFSAIVSLGPKALMALVSLFLHLVA